MKLYRSYKDIFNIKGSVITLGNFDGLHVAHTHIIESTIKRAKELSLPSFVYTFWPHPANVLLQGSRIDLLTTLPEKLSLLSKVGVDAVILENFTKEFSEICAEDFIKEILVEKLKVKEIFLGTDFRFGKGGKGSVSLLRNFGKDFGFLVNEVGPITICGEVVKSSRIRELVKTGDVKKASIFLGRRYSIKGKIVKGSGIGKKIGFPTANISDFGKLHPKEGVYAVFVSLENSIYKGVMNIGKRPTFGGEKLSFEVHILDFKKEIYEKVIEVFFVDRIRDEKRFFSVSSLCQQIKEDISKAKNILYEDFFHKDYGEGEKAFTFS